jgi:23S rRNA pseudouridine1911/1915/1917 synthase
MINEQRKIAENITQTSAPRRTIDTIKAINNDTGMRMQNRINKQKECFTRHEEWWLLNRLDTDTSGYLYFAKNKVVYTLWDQWQREGLVEKVYIGCLEHDLTPVSLFPPKDNACKRDQNTQQLIVSWPLLHHKHLSDRMVVANTTKKVLNNWWKLQDTVTYIQFLPQAPRLVIIRITLGKRHQIRAHLAASWYPLVWDTLYGKSMKQIPLLHLRSRGLVWKNTVNGRS